MGLVRLQRLAVLVQCGHPICRVVLGAVARGVTLGQRTSRRVGIRRLVAEVRVPVGSPGCPGYTIGSSLLACENVHFVEKTPSHRPAAAVRDHDEQEKGENDRVAILNETWGPPACGWSAVGQGPASRPSIGPSSSQAWASFVRSRAQVRADYAS